MNSLRRSLIGAFLIEPYIVERVGQDLGRPGKTGQRVADHEQLHRPKDEPGDCQPEPEPADIAGPGHQVGVRRQESEEIGVEQEQQRQPGPDAHQHPFAEQVVADLDLFLVGVGRLVDVVVAPGLEEEMAALAGGHRDQPAEQSGERRIEEEDDVGGDEGHRADQVEGLVDAAVMIVAMIVPALEPELGSECAHSSSLPGL